MELIWRFIETGGWTILGLLLFYAGLRFYDWLDPIDYQAEIKRGNVAAGVLLGAIVVSLAAIIVAVIVTP